MVVLDVQGSGPHCQQCCRVLVLSFLPTVSSSTTWDGQGGKCLLSNENAFTSFQSCLLSFFEPDPAWREPCPR